MNLSEINNKLPNADEIFRFAQYDLFFIFYWKNLLNKEYIRFLKFSLDGKIKKNSAFLLNSFAFSFVNFMLIFY